jgi:hypothetical protein
VIDKIAISSSPIREELVIFIEPQKNRDQLNVMDVKPKRGKTLNGPLRIFLLLGMFCGVLFFL